MDDLAAIAKQLNQSPVERLKNYLIDELKIKANDETLIFGPNAYEWLLRHCDIPTQLTANELDMVLNYNGGNFKADLGNANDDGIRSVYISFGVYHPNTTKTRILLVDDQLVRSRNG